MQQEKDRIIEIPLIMQKYPGLKKIPKENISKRPVPIQKLTGLEKELDCPNIYMKREEFSHDVYGGNKARKYDYQMADILKKRRKIVITSGGIGSNQVLANAIYCKQYGLKAVGFLDNEVLSEQCRYNMLLDYYYGSELHYSKGQVVMVLKMLWYYLTHRGSYFVWWGTSTPLATIGFVDAAFELKQDIEQGKLPEPDYLFVPDGSTGTTAGLTLGLELAGLKTKVYGVMVAFPLFSTKKSVLGLSMKTYKLLKKYDKSIPKITKNMLSKRMDVLKDFFGGEYGLATEEGREAIELFKKCDNVEIDQTYVGKTAAAMIAFIRLKKNELQGKTILIWNTLNMVDHSREAASIDYHLLPKELHQFFDGTVPLETRCVKSRSNPNNIC